MAASMITGLDPLTGANSATGDLFVVVDISDTTMGAGGTDKNMTRAELAIAIANAFTLGNTPLNIGSGALTAGAGSFTKASDFGTVTLNGLTTAYPGIILSNATYPNFAGIWGEGSGGHVKIGTAAGSAWVDVTSAGAAVTGNIDGSGRLRVTSASPSIPASGTGLEIYYATDTFPGSPGCYMYVYDRTGGAWKPIVISGSSVNLQVAGTTVIGLAAGAATVTGALSATGDTTTSGNTIVSSANAATWTHGQASELLTLSTSGTTTDTSANLLPANSIIESVVARVTTTITTATDWKLGDPTTAGRFTAANATMAAGATDVGLVHIDQSGAAGPRQTAAAKVRVTTTGTPGAGAIRITVFYRTLVAPTS